MERSRTTFYFNNELKLKLKILAAREKTSISAILEELARNYLIEKEMIKKEESVL